LIKQKNRKLTELLESTDIVIPSLLGKSFRIADDPEVYQVIGTRWRSKEVVLRANNTEKTMTVVGHDFLKTATMVSE
jgi:hypothetical protein